MPEQPFLHIELDERRTALNLRVLVEGEEHFRVSLEAPELDDVIRALADGRAQLKEEVAPELDEGARITNTVVDPAYLLGKNTREGKALLVLRHPGLGWLGFQFRRDAIAALVRELRGWLEGR